MTNDRRHNHTDRDRPNRRPPVCFLDRQRPAAGQSGAEVASSTTASEHAGSAGAGEVPGPRIIQGDARAIPLPDHSVDLVVTSPPYLGLRTYTDDGGTPYDGQIGAEPTPAAYLAALLACTREWVRVLKPTGSIWVNLGDRYSTGASGTSRLGHRHDAVRRARKPVTGVAPKSLLMLPERYRIACVDRLGLIARAVVIWDKPNAMPESVTDRVRRSHEDWVHLTVSRHYYSAVDEIREPHKHGGHGLTYDERKTAGLLGDRDLRGARACDCPGEHTKKGHPLGRLPGSVWQIPTQPLKVPPELGVDHFAAYPPALVRPIILGWSPREVCTTCGEGRQPILDRTPPRTAPERPPTQLTGWACACPEPTAPSTRGVVLDPFGGTGTTALVACVLGRYAISIDASRDYTRLARWRVSDPGQRERATRRPGRPRAATRRSSRPATRTDQGPRSTTHQHCNHRQHDIRHPDRGDQT